MVISSQDTHRQIQNPDSEETSPTDPKNYQPSFKWKEKGGQ